MLHVRQQSIAYQIGSPAKIQSALEHIADIVEDLVVEANLPLIVFVLDASRAQQNVVVVVGAVQSQLLFRSSERMKNMIAIAHHVIKAIHINATSMNESTQTQKQPRIGHDLKQKLAARSADPGEFGTSLVLRPQNNIANELNTLNQSNSSSHSRSRPCHTPKSPLPDPIFESNCGKLAHSLFHAIGEARSCNAAHSADTYDKALHGPNRGQDRRYTQLASLAP